MSSTHVLDQRVAVVSGPVSEEDALYLREADPQSSSLAALLESLRRSEVHAEHLDPTSSTFVRDVEAFDAVFLNVHGPYGEDGRIQGLLDYLAIPYVNSGVAASAIGMDKLVTKAVFAYLGISTPATPVTDGTPGVVLDEVPFMLKAAGGGSSVGIELVTRLQDAADAHDRIRSRGFERIFAEAFVPGRSITVGVLEHGGRPTVLPALETVHDRPFYDEQAKLRGDDVGTWYREPYDLDPRLVEEMNVASERIYTFLGCRGAVRVDFMVTDGAVLALEINTAPGLQPHSNLPAAAQLAGIDYDTLVLSLLESACRRGNPLPWVPVA